MSPRTSAAAAVSVCVAERMVCVAPATSSRKATVPVLSGNVYVLAAVFECVNFPRFVSPPVVPAKSSVPASFTRASFAPAEVENASPVPSCAQDCPALNAPLARSTVPLAHDTRGPATTMDVDAGRLTLVGSWRRVSASGTRNIAPPDAVPNGQRDLPGSVVYTVSPVDVRGANGSRWSVAGAPASYAASSPGLGVSFVRMSGEPGTVDAGRRSRLGADSSKCEDATGEAGPVGSLMGVVGWDAEPVANECRARSMSCIPLWGPAPPRPDVTVLPWPPGSRGMSGGRQFGSSSSA